jgi:tRNA U34 2-thiouridine synthase MnmA/TrmU
MAVNKIVLAYSGGLDTSVILKWLQEEYQCPVVAFAADLGQDEDWQGISSSRPSGPMRFTRGLTFSGLRWPGRSSPWNR